MEKPFFFLLALSLSLGLQGSKPLSERSEETCEAFLADGQTSHAIPFAPSTLIPLHTLLGSTRCANVAKLWREGDFHDKRFPSPGTLEMFRTAEIAAESVVANLGIEAVKPVYDGRSPLAGAEATLKLIESKRPPAYIRQAILIRENVLMAVPILKRISAKDPKTGRPVYVPIITKGHQELDDFDVLSAAFAAWALKPWIGQIPNKAYVFLRSMLKQRSKRVASQKNYFEIDTRDYLSRVTNIHERFVGIVSSDDALASIGPSRCTHCARCPWANFCKKQMTETKHLSMVPFPPTLMQQAILTRMGYGTLSELAKLDVNGEKFFEIALTAAISPERLHYFVSRALSTEQDKPIIRKEFTNPFPADVARVDVDFEDFPDGKLKSGVYLIGAKIKEPGKPLGPYKKFEAKPLLEQAAQEENIAEFFRYLKKHKALKGKDYLISIYSKHEIVKFEQAFDIYKQPIAKFSEKEKASRFYREFEINGARVGRLIRHEEFFNRFRDISPDDVFEFFNRTIDLLDFSRKNIAFPTASNGLKSILPYIQDEKILDGKTRLEYPQGSNGLESIAWARHYAMTQEPHEGRRIGSYNDLDVQGNDRDAAFLSYYAGQEVDAALRWNDESVEKAAIVDEAVSLRKFAADLNRLSSLFASALGKEVSELTDKQANELSAILDRSEYLATLRKLATDGSHENNTIRADRQLLRFAYLQARTDRLRKFLLKVNPKAEKDILSESAQAIVTLNELPTNVLTPDNLTATIAFERLLPFAEDLELKAAKSFRDAAEVPGFWLNALGTEETDEINAKALNKVWSALYYYKRYPVPGDAKDLGRDIP